MRTIIDLPEGQLAALDRIAKSRKLSRTALVRQAVERYVAEQAPERGAAFGLWRRAGGQSGARALRAPCDQRHLVDRGDVGNETRR